MKTLVIVAGSTGGIGSAIVKRVLHEKKYSVLALYRNKQKYNDWFKEDSSENLYSCKYETLNEELESLYLQEKNVGRIVLVQSLFTIQPIKKIENLTIDDIQKNIQSNIVLNIVIIQSVVEFCKRKNLKIDVINLDSGAAYRPLEGWSLYSSSKAYLNMFLKSYLCETKDMRVVSLDPGVVDTDMQKEIRETSAQECGMVEIFRGYKEKKELRQPEEIASFILKQYIDNWIASNFEEKYRKS